jgi:hypothetical protein
MKINFLVVRNNDNTDMRIVVIAPPTPPNSDAPFISTRSMQITNHENKFKGNNLIVQ